MLAQTAPYDHCNFTALDDAPREPREPLPRVVAGECLTTIRKFRQLLDLEGLKAWKPGRVDGYRALERAVEEMKFYDDHGNITIADYRY